MTAFALEDGERDVRQVGSHDALEARRSIGETPTAQEGGELVDDLVGNVDACKSHRQPEFFSDACESQTLCVFPRG